MGRAKGEGQITKLADGRWRARVTRNGRTLSASRPTRREAVAALEGLKVRLGLSEEGASTLGVWLDRWLAQADLAYESRRLYTRMVNEHLHPHLGHLPIGEVTTPLLQRTYADMKADGVGTATIGRVHSVLSSALGEAARQGLIEVVPTVHAKPPRHVKAKPKPLTPEQARQLLAAFRQPGAPSGRLLATLLLLGLRVGEAVDLRWHHVDGDWLTVPGTKTGASAALLPLAGPVRDVLGEPGRPNRPVFPSRRDDRTPTSRQTVSRDFHRYLDALDIPRRRIHDLRHSTGSLLASVGVPTRVIQSVLRHDSAAMSVHYSRPHDPALVDAVGALGDALN